MKITIGFVILIIFGLWGVAISQQFTCEPVEVEGNSVVFKASNPMEKDKACYKIAMTVQRWRDAVSADGRSRDSLQGIVWNKRDIYVCPPGDEEDHYYRETFGLPGQRTEEVYAIKIVIWPGPVSYRLKFRY
jgi:hypothetical protein